MKLTRSNHPLINYLCFKENYCILAPLNPAWKCWRFDSKRRNRLLTLSQFSTLDLKISGLPAGFESWPLRCRWNDLPVQLSQNVTIWCSNEITSIKAHITTFYGLVIDPYNNQLPVGLIVQLLERCLHPLCRHQGSSSEFFRPFFCPAQVTQHNWEDHNIEIVSIRIQMKFQQ